MKHIVTVLILILSTMLAGCDEKEDVKEQNKFFKKYTPKKHNNYKRF